MTGTVAANFVSGFVFVLLLCVFVDLDHVYNVGTSISSDCGLRVFRFCTIITSIVLCQFVIRSRTSSIKLLLTVFSDCDSFCRSSLSVI